MTSQEKALELVAENRIVLLKHERAVVAGEHGHYYIRADRDGIHCTCPSRSPYCSHILAAMVLWNDRLEAQYVRYAVA